MGVKISELPIRAVIDGSEIIPVVYNEDNYSVSLNAIKSIITKIDVGLDQVDNTSDIDKPISIAVQNALNGKADIGHTHNTADINGLTSFITNLIQTTTSPSDVSVPVLEW